MNAANTEIRVCRLQSIQTNTLTTRGHIRIYENEPTQYVFAIHTTKGGQNVFCTWRAGVNFTSSTETCITCVGIHITKMNYVIRVCNTHYDRGSKCVFAGGGRV